MRQRALLAWFLACSAGGCNPPHAAVRDASPFEFERGLPLISSLVLQEPRSHPIGFIETAVVGRDGRIFIADRPMREIKMFSPTGTFLGVLGRIGAGPGEYAAPLWLSLNSDSSEITVTDAGGQFATVFQLADTSRTRRLYLPSSLVPLQVEHVGHDTVLVAGIERVPKGKTLVALGLNANGRAVNTVLPATADGPVEYARTYQRSLVSRTGNTAFAMSNADPWVSRFRIGDPLLDSLRLPGNIVAPIEWPTHHWRDSTEQWAFMGGRWWVRRLAALDSTRVIIELMHYVKDGDSLPYRLAFARFDNDSVSVTDRCDCRILAVAADSVLLQRSYPPEPVRLEWRRLPPLGRGPR